MGAKEEARLYLLIIYWTADKLMSANLPTGLVGNVQEKAQAPHSVYDVFRFLYRWEKYRDRFIDPKE